MLMIKEAIPHYTREDDRILFNLFPVVGISPGSLRSR
jgi:hypothetical protein